MKRTETETKKIVLENGSLDEVLDVLASLPDDIQDVSCILEYQRTKGSETLSLNSKEDTPKSNYEHTVQCASYDDIIDACHAIGVERSKKQIQQKITSYQRTYDRSVPRIRLDNGKTVFKMRDIALILSTMRTNSRQFSEKIEDVLAQICKYNVPRKVFEK